MPEYHTPRRVIEISEVRLSTAVAEWGIKISAKIKITAPEREPPVLTLLFETRVKEHPAESSDDLGIWVLNLLADRLEKPMPECDTSSE